MNDNVKAAVRLINLRGSMRLDELHALGVMQDEFEEALSEMGKRFSVKDYGNGILGDDNPFGDRKPSSLYIDLKKW